MKKNKSIYFNEKQIAFLQAVQPIRLLLWGRGTGKSTAIAGINYQRLRAMPRAKTFFSSTTYNQILTKTLPAIENKWEELGLIEGIHYVVGKRPPKNFQSPFSPPRKYENVISFFNGYCIEFLSMDRPDLARGGSYDGGDIDEAALIQQEHFNKILLPSIRGNRHRFATHLHQNVNLYTSIPWKPSGYWILDYEEKAEAYPEEYFFSEANAYDNIHILGEKGIQRMEQELSYLEFQIEVMNKRIRKVPDGFYHKFEEQKHCYTPRYRYDTAERGIITKGQEDVRNDHLLEVSFDFSGWFNCCSVYQERKNTEYCVRQFYVKQDDKINELVNNFCKHFEQHRFKFVRVWGEPRGHDKNPLGDSIYDQIAAMFTKQGWDVEIRAHSGRTNNHLERHQLVNDLLDEVNPGLPKLRFNQDNCKDMIIAIQVTEIDKDYKKDKSKEKDRKYPQEHAPHFTDTLDYYLIQKHGWKLQSGSQSSGSVSFH